MSIGFILHILLHWANNEPLICTMEGAKLFYKSDVSIFSFWPIILPVVIGMTLISWNVISHGMHV